MAKAVMPLARRMQAELDTLARVNQETSIGLLRAADARLARVRAVETLLGIGLVGGFAVVWWTALGMLARHRRQLADHMARIEASNRDLDAFAARIAHDLRNALSPVGLIAGSLRATRDPDLVARLATRLRDTVRRSEGLIEGLLAFSRAGRPPDAGACAPMSAMVHEVLDELAPLGGRVGAEIEVDVADEAVRCPAALLHLIGANLIGNALKYLEGRPHRSVRIAARRVAGGWCELTVADSGPGIPTDSLPQVFEPFYRVPGTLVAGTGIGLATVRRIVDQYGGEVVVESVLGRGSIFRVRLPTAIQRPAERHEHRAPTSA
jgi:signal transduction histidine kinase